MHEVTQHAEDVHHLGPRAVGEERGLGEGETQGACRSSISPTRAWHKVCQSDMELVMCWNDGSESHGMCSS